MGFSTKFTFLVIRRAPDTEAEGAVVVTNWTTALREKPVTIVHRDKKSAALSSGAMAPARAFGQRRGVPSLYLWITMLPPPSAVGSALSTSSVTPSLLS